MGFPVFLRIDDHHVPRSAADAVFSWLRAVDERFRPFRPDSEVSRLDRGELPESEVSPDLAEVLALCEEYRPASGGAFDVRLPGRGLDPCAAVKGWSVQRAAELLSAAGARRFVLGAGGPWRVGVRHPEDADRLRTVLELTGGAAVASARYERGDHIAAGRTGRPATGPRSLTVVAASLTEADAVAHGRVRDGRRGRRAGRGSSGPRGPRRGRGPAGTADGGFPGTV